MRRWTTRALLGAALAAVSARAGQAQEGAERADSAAQGGGARMAAPVLVGSEAERALRALQTLGMVAPHPWSNRGFSAAELDRLRPSTGEHPWGDLPELRAGRRRGPRWALIPPQVDLWYNSAFPFGYNDGAVWRGRGATVAAEGGVAARWGALSLTLAPLAFWAENRDFGIFPNGETTELRFGDRWAHVVDRPQRFGDRAYGRVDPGQSTLRVDALGLTTGISTANLWWGPMAEFPFLLGNNAAGMPHLFAGSSTPWNVGIGRAHGRVVYARLEQSDYAVLPDSMGRRFGAGFIGVFTPRGLPTLELGAARFYHTLWGRGPETEDFLRPFQALLKDAHKKRAKPGDVDVGGDQANQLASVFFRWVLPRSGMEVYGEFGREDHNSNAYDLIQEPDHSASYGIGFARTARRRDGLLIVRGELMNFRVSTLQYHRAQGALYVHTQVNQGHTHLGQLLGAGFGIMSGAGSVVSVERLRQAGTGWRAAWTRLNTLDHAGLSATGRPNIDVQHALTVERRARFGGVEVNAGLTGIYELNRYFLIEDVGSAQASMRLRWVGRSR